MGLGDVAKDLFQDSTKNSASPDDSGEYSSADFEKAGEMKDIHTKRVDPNSSTPALDEFGVNMTELAKNGAYDRVIGNIMK